MDFMRTMQELLRANNMNVGINVQDQVQQMRNTLVPKIRDDVLHLNAAPMGTEFKWTLVYCVLCTGYETEEFEVDVQNIARRYNVPSTHLLRYPIRGTDLVPDEKQAFSDLMKIIKRLNNANITDEELESETDVADATPQANAAVEPVKYLRIYEVGIKETGLMNSLFKYLLKKWQSDHKAVQIIHGSNKLTLDFWKKAILKKLCNHVEYVSRNDYNALGTLD